MMYLIDYFSHRMIAKELTPSVELGNGLRTAQTFQILYNLNTQTNNESRYLIFHLELGVVVLEKFNSNSLIEVRKLIPEEFI